MNRNNIFERKGAALAAITFIFAFFFYYYLAAEFFYCVFAALLTAGIIWGTYLVMRICYLAYKEE